MLRDDTLTIEASAEYWEEDFGFRMNINFQGVSLWYKKTELLPFTQICPSSAGQLLPPEPPPEIPTPPPPSVDPPTAPIPSHRNCGMPDSAPSHESVTGE